MKREYSVVGNATVRTESEVLNVKQYYRDKIIELINKIDNLSVLEWLYHFITDGINNRW